MTVKIGGREYKVVAVNTNEDNPLFREEILKNGWDGNLYTLVGKRGAVKAAYRSAHDGKFSILF